MTHALLFEIGTEELPPSELPAVLRALEATAAGLLDEARLRVGSLTVYSTPRRLAVSAGGVATRQAPQRIRVIGPPRKAAFDAAGKPTRAAEGFARSQGVAVDRLVVVDTDRGEYLAIDREDQGRPAAEVLPEILERLGGSVPFAKQMRWGDGDVRFSRPVRWVVALLDDVVLPVTVAGVRADRVTYGHRFLHPEAIELSNPDEYTPRLESASVIPDVAARRALIQREVEAAAGAHGFRPLIRAETLETVTHLVELPMAVVGSFPAEYLTLPREVIETPIRRHQKCFAAETSNGGLAPYFVTVSNMPGADPTEIRRGNERVIRARLADADFYFREDLKHAPEDRLALLASMVFQERLGSQLERTQRLVALSDWLASTVAPQTRKTVTRAARLAKSDLASGMVREFPELQGIIGEEYALRAGEPPDVARAIREHYLPRTADDALPASPGGGVLAIADRIDTIVGCVGVGLLPTGSQDPYALRRHAHGIIQIAVAGSFSLSLGELIDRAAKLLAEKLSEPGDLTAARVLELLRTRLSTLLVARGLRADVVDAVIARGFDDPIRAVQRAEALATLMREPDWEPLAITFKRAINILPDRPIGAIDPSRFSADAERRLHDETQQRRPSALRALERADYVAALRELAGLRPAVDQFFEAVMVMDKDPAVQENRLALLRALADLVLPVADLRKVQAAR